MMTFENLLVTIMLFFVVLIGAIALWDWWGSRKSKVKELKK